MKNEPRRFDHIRVRKDYPNGYVMERKALPDWIYITIMDIEDSKYLTVHSSIHIGKEEKVGPAYSMAFTDEQILRDLSGDISHRFL